MNVLKMAELFYQLSKKADYSAYFLDATKALKTLKNNIQSLDIKSFQQKLEIENDEYKYLPGYLMGEDYKDCRIQFKFSDESSKEGKFLNISVNPYDKEDEENNAVSTPIGKAYFQNSYDLELNLPIGSFKSCEQRIFENGRVFDSFLSFSLPEDEEGDIDPYMDKIKDIYLEGLKKAIVMTCSTVQPDFYHELAHLKRMRKQNPRQFAEQWRPGEASTLLKEWQNVNVKTDTELFPGEIQRIAKYFINLVQSFKSQDEYPTFLKYLASLGLDLGNKEKFVNYIVNNFFGSDRVPSYEKKYPRSIVKRISKFYDDLAAGRLDDLKDILP